MKNLIWLLLLLMTSWQLAEAQPTTSSDSPFRFEISINATRFLNDLVSFNDRTVDPGPYVLSAKFFRKKTGIRIGIGGDYSKERDNEAITVVRENISAQFNLRAGLEQQFPVGQRWLFYLGFDALYSYHLLDDISETGIDIVSIRDSGNTYGLGPLLGIQFHINQRIALWTESSLYYTYTRAKIDTAFQNNTLPDQSIRRITHQGIMNLPVAIFFALRF